MATDLKMQLHSCRPGDPDTLPDAVLLVSDAVFGPETPLHISDAQMAAEFAYIIACYSTPEPDRHE